MVAKSKRLQVVVNLAERELHDSAAALAKVNQQYHFEEGRLQELQTYFEEYQQQAKQQWGSGISVSQLMNFNYFLNNLRQAIEQQQQTLAHLQRVCERARQQWLNHKAKHVNLCDLQKKALQDEDKMLEKKLQRDIDDNFSKLK